jgi:hypothetical protein
VPGAAQALPSQTCQGALPELTTGEDVGAAADEAAADAEPDTSGQIDDDRLPQGEYWRHRGAGLQAAARWHGRPAGCALAVARGWRAVRCGAVRAEHDPVRDSPGRSLPVGRQALPGTRRGDPSLNKWVKAASV